MEDEKFTAQHVDAVQASLQALFEQLPEEQKPVLETLLSHAVEGGLSASPSSVGERSIIIVSGRGRQYEIPLNPGVAAGLNPQPIPPGRTPNGPDPSPLQGNSA